MRRLRPLAFAALAALAHPAWAQNAPVQPQQQEQAAIDAALQLYRALLLQAVMQQRSYPEAALAQRQVGSVDIEITIGADGKLERETLIKSSRHAPLDEHALALVQRAAALTDIPAALRGRAFRVAISVNYALAE